MAAEASVKCGMRFLGKKSGVKVSNLCLGTMTFGESDKALIKLPGQMDEEDCFKICDRFVELGGNFFDTADAYSAGRSEEILGKWLSKQQRDRFFIATKVRFPTDITEPNSVGLSRHHILTGVEQSLKRLQTSYIDLLFTHCWDEGTPIEETLRVLNDLVTSGKVHYVGVSNVTGWQLQKIMDLNRQFNYQPIVALQAQYSLLCRQTEWELLDVCQREGVAMLPWSPLKGGLLSGKVTRETSSSPPEGSRMAWALDPKNKLQSAPYIKDFDTDKTWNLIEGMAEIGKTTEHSVAQVALKWLLHQGGVDSVVIGAKRLSQLEDNMKAGNPNWTLSAEEIAKLNELSAIPVPYPYEMVTRCQRGRV
eukprot:scpid74234/ scgid29267/ Uncharacterized oxidoreductase YajO